MNRQGISRYDGRELASTCSDWTSSQRCNGSPRMVMSRWMFTGMSSKLPQGFEWAMSTMSRWRVTSGTMSCVVGDKDPRPTSRCWTAPHLATVGFTGRPALLHIIAEFQPQCWRNDAKFTGHTKSNHKCNKNCRVTGWYAECGNERRVLSLSWQAHRKPLFPCHGRDALQRKREVERARSDFSKDSGGKNRGAALP